MSEPHIKNRSWRRPAKHIAIEAVDCVLCGRCADVCPPRALFLLPLEDASADRIRIGLLYQDGCCTRCLLCVRTCPSGACQLVTRSAAAGRRTFTDATHDEIVHDAVGEAAN